MRLPYHRVCREHNLPRGGSIKAVIKLPTQNSEISTVVTATVSSEYDDSEDSLTHPVDSEVTPEPAKTTRSIADLRILMVEDNKINQRVLQAMLCRLGVDKEDNVTNGQDAVDRSGTHDYDMILMDFEMPKM